MTSEIRFIILIIQYLYFFFTLYDIVFFLFYRILYIIYFSIKII